MEKYVINKIAQLYDEWLSLQPLKQEDKDRLERKFMLEFNYNSNHIEGNTLTYGQTELLLFFGKVTEDADMKDLEEMKAHNVCLQMIKEEASEKEHPLTEAFIRQLHHTLLREDYTMHKQLPDGTDGVYVVHAGSYKTRPNSVITVTGERFEYASPEETPALMTDLVDWYNVEEQRGELSPLELATVFHYRYIRIHPFEDGNGRIARLLVNYILHRHNYPMIVVKTDDKQKYLRALNSCDVQVGLIPSVGSHAKLSQLQPFVEYMATCLERALNVSVRAARGENIEDTDDWKKNLRLKYQDRLNKPALTEEIGLKILNMVFKPLLAYIHSELSEFYSLFTAFKWEPHEGSYTKEGSDLYFSTMIFRKYRIEGRIIIGIIMMQFAYGIRLEFSRKDTVLGVASKGLYEKELFYLEELKGHDYTEIMTAIGKCLNDFLENAE